MNSALDGLRPVVTLPTLALGVLRDLRGRRLTYPTGIVHAGGRPAVGHPGANSIRRPVATARILFAGLLLILASTLLSASALAAPRPLPIADYWRKLADTRALALRLASGPAESARQPFASAADEWSAITNITLADGTALAVDHTALLAALRADPPAPARVADLAAAMAAQQAGWPAPSHTAADLDSLTRILAQPDFQWPAAQRSWLDDLRDRFLNFLSRLLARLFSNTGLGGNLFGLGQLLSAAAVLAVAAVLIYALRGLFLNFAPEARAPDDDSAGDQDLTAASASRRAASLAEGGDHRSAVRYLYLAALLHLEEAGLLRYDRSLTNREYLRSLGARPELADRLRGVVDVFDRVWYGFDAIDDAAYAEYAARVAQLRQQK